MNENTRFPYRFFLVAFLWSWIIWIPLVLGSQGILPLSPTLTAKLALPFSTFAAFGPLAGALYALRREEGKGSGRAYLRSFLNLRLGWKGYLLPLAILGGSTAVAWILPEFFGKARTPMLFPSALFIILYFPLMVFLGGGQEELGWRGYALPRLEKHYGLWGANVMLGVMWACWHLPLWFITGTSQTYMNFGGFILLTVGYSFMFSWFRQVSGNRPFSGLFAHGTANALIPLMPVLQMQQDVPQPRFWIWVILTFVLGILITLYRTSRSSAGS